MGYAGLARRLDKDSADLGWPGWWPGARLGWAGQEARQGWAGLAELSEPWQVRIK